MLLGIIGFFAGYLIFGEFMGVDLSLKHVIFGTDTGVNVIDQVANEATSNARQQVWISAAAGALLGIVIAIARKKR